MSIITLCRSALLLALLFLTGCGGKYFLKQEAGEFSKAAGEAIGLVTVLPQRIKTAEANLQRNMVLLDENCRPENGKIIFSKTEFLYEGKGLEKLVPEADCRNAVVIVRGCRAGKNCFNCAPGDGKCLRAQSLAQVSDTCLSQAVVNRLPATCASQLWETREFPSPEGRKASLAYQSTADLAAKALEFVDALSRLSLDREESSAKHVNAAIADLKNVVEKTNEVLGAGTIELGDEAHRNAYVELAKLLAEWIKITDDAAKIRELIRRDGEAFRRQLGDIALSADFLQKTYLRALTESDAALLRSRYAAKVTGLSEIERDWWMRIIADADGRAKVVQAEAPVSEVLKAVSDAQQELARIASGNFTTEERAEIARINLKQFGRLVNRLKAVYPLI